MKENRLQRLGAALLMAMLLGGVAGCEDEEPMEQAEENVEEAAENAGDNVEEMGEEIQDSAEDVQN